jgi:hypothetical protein
MRKPAVNILFLVIVVVMAATNFIGMRSMLQYARDASVVPALQFIMFAVGRDPAVLRPDLQISPAVAAQQLSFSEGKYALELSPIPGPAFGFLDRFEKTDGRRGLVSGWTKSPDPARKVAMVGVWVNGASRSAVVADTPRPDVDAALGQYTGRSGFELAFDADVDDICKVGVFVINDILEMRWLHEPGAGCQP